MTYVDVPDGRHPGTVHLARTLEPNPNLPLKQSDISREVARLGRLMIHNLKDGPELTAGLRKLREAKDCFVLQSLADEGKL